MTPDVSRETDAPPEDILRAAFGVQWELAVRYTDLLVTDGVDWGLIGPREVPRIWSRHVLHCAALEQHLPADVHMCDVGSGAGLPGIPVALARPDVAVTLVEPLQRRVVFLDRVVAELGLQNVTVVRGRAEEVRGQYGVVTARAVAALSKLVPWCAPLVARGGYLVAMKGARAADELAAAGPVLRRAGLGEAEVITTPVAGLSDPLTVIRARRVR